MNTYVILGFLVIALGSWLVYFGQKQDGDSGQNEVIGAVNSSSASVKSDTQKILQSMEKLVKDADQNKPDVIAQARRNYPHGFALFGYAGGETFFKPYEGSAEFRVTADWGSSTIRFDPADDAVIFAIKEIHLVAGVWKVNFMDFEWTCHPIQPQEPVRCGMVQTPHGLLVVVLELFQVDGESNPIYLIGFKLEQELEAPLTPGGFREIGRIEYTPN